MFLGLVFDEPVQVGLGRVDVDADKGFLRGLLSRFGIWKFSISNQLF